MNYMVIITEDAEVDIDKFLYYLWKRKVDKIDGDCKKTCVQGK